jgi:predicted transcriptional regulator YdeE
MEPRIVERDQMILIGLSFFGDPFAESAGWTEENEIGRLWNRFMAYLAEQGDGIQGIKEEDVAYEVHIESADTAAKGYREVFVGVEVDRLADVPVELLVKVLPAATYAVFTLKGEQISADWSMSMGEWMRRSPYEPVGNFGFQLYDQRFRGVDDLAASELDVFVPIKRTADVSPERDL